MDPVSARDCWPRKPEFGGAPRGADPALSPAPACADLPKPMI